MFVWLISEKELTGDTWRDLFTSKGHAELVYMAVFRFSWVVCSVVSCLYMLVGVDPDSSGSYMYCICISMPRAIIYPSYLDSHEYMNVSHRN